MKKKTVAKKATKKTVRKVTKKVVKKPVKKAVHKVTKKVTKRKYTRRAPALDHEPKEAVEISINVEAPEDLLQAVQRDYIESLQAQLEAKDAPSFLETIEILDITALNNFEIVSILADLERLGYKVYQPELHLRMASPTDINVLVHAVSSRHLKFNHINRLVAFASAGEIDRSDAVSRVVSMEVDLCPHIRATDPGKRVKPSVEVDGQLYDLRT